MNLPLDVQIRFLSSLSVEDLSAYCQSSTEINRLCTDPIFIRDFFSSRWGVNSQEVPGTTLLEKVKNYQILEEIDNLNFDVKSQDPSIYRSPLGGEIYLPVRDLLLQAVSTNDPNFVKLVVDKLVDRHNRYIESLPLPLIYSGIIIGRAIRSRSELAFNSSFRDALLEALRRNQHQISNILHTVYNPQYDFIPD